MTTPSVGETAPAFDLPVAGGGKVSSASLSGSAYVLFFYPKADTPGCTNEAKDFTALKADFERHGVRVIGVSKDSVKKLEKFAAKHALDVTLVSDEEGDLCERYGVWTEKSMYGKTYMGIERTTVLVGNDGRVAHIWPRVKVKGHADAVLAEVSSAA
ncbi:MAG: thioredoxin-dependent thiol peroxidase [Brevundimonas sp.]|jgi:peroxiredoxin Q/BCP|uniref:thioredoxin-dependent thiol peroxidase n=1 Tax=Brevundimonas sp. TaxID=1871086 RepID=UPI00391C4750